MLLVDAQIHVWGAETPDRPWLPGASALAHRPHPLGADEVLAAMDRVGVQRTLLVAPGWEGPRNDLVVDAALRWPDRFGAIARLALDDPAAAATLPSLVADPGVRSLRAVFYRSTAPWLDDGTAEWFWPAAEAAGLPVSIYAPGRYDAVARIAAAHPSTRFLIDHLGIDAAVHDGAITSAIDGVVGLADLPNVAVKVSSLPSFVSDVDRFPFPSLHAPIRRVIEAFGAHRAFWGSDLSRLTCTYEEQRDLFLHHLPFLSGDDLAMVMGRGLCEWLGWAVPSPGEEVAPRVP